MISSTECIQRTQARKTKTKVNIYIYIHTNSGKNVPEMLKQLLRI